MHEAALHKFNYFLTLTYNDENLEKKCKKVVGEDFVYTLPKKEFQLFMKRLRKEFGNGIKFYHCGEYGEQNGRPHHHACIFNLNIPDLEKWKTTEGGDLCTSDMLKRIWGNGYVVVGSVTFESACYVARYITKKITGAMAETHYGGIDPEYSTMSRRPGLGKKFYDLNQKKIMFHDQIIMRGGLTMRPPKMYDKWTEAADSMRMEEIKYDRLKNFNRKDNTQKRLSVKEEIEKAKAKLYQRRSKCR